MEQVQLYAKHKGLQKNDAIYVIENYLRLVKWQKGDNDTILDIGCGDGQVTIDVLLPHLPANFAKLLGTDVSENMVKFANEKYRLDKVDFIKLDVSANETPIDFQLKFNHIFSFYCFHWVQNQRQAFKNVFNMLVPGGDMLITFLASNPIFDIYENMSKNIKWAPFMDDMNNFISPYHRCKDPEKKLESLLIETGFVSHVCRAETRSYTFLSLNNLKKSIRAVNPFLARLPENEENNYIDDYITEMRNVNNVAITNCNNNNDEKIICQYKLFIVFASKSLDSIVHHQG